MPKKIFKCETCGYETTRKFNLDLHMSKKNPCVRKENGEQSQEIGNIVNVDVNFVNENVNVVKENVNVVNGNVNGDVNVKTSNDNKVVNNKKYECEVCFKLFNTRQAKFQHKKNVKCKSPKQVHIEEDYKDIKEELKSLQTKLQLMENGKAGQVTNNTDNSTNNSTVDNSVTDNSINNTIIYNNYNKPYTGHISKQTMIDIYNDCKAEMSMMIYSLVKKIYKDHPENDCIKFPEGIKSGFAEVQYNDQKCILPVNEVLETVLTKTTSVGKKKLMKAYENDDVIGHNMEDILDEMSTLSLNFRNEKDHRGLHLPYVKSALML